MTAPSTGSTLRDIAVDQAGEVLRRAVGDETFAAVTACLSVGLDGAEDAGTGYPSAALDMAHAVMRRWTEAVGS